MEVLWIMIGEPGGADGVQLKSEASSNAVYAYIFGFVQLAWRRFFVMLAWGTSLPHEYKRYFGGR